MNRQQTCTCLGWDWIWYRKLYHWNYPKRTWSLHFSKKYLACVWWWGYDLLWIHLGKGERRTSGMKRRIKKKIVKKTEKRRFPWLFWIHSLWKVFLKNEGFSRIWEEDVQWWEVYIYYGEPKSHLWKVFFAHNRIENKLSTKRTFFWTIFPLLVYLSPIIFHFYSSL